MKKTIAAFAIVIIGSLLLYTSCTDAILNKKNQNGVNSQTFYKTPQQAVQSVNAAYAILQTGYLWGRSIFFLLGFTADEGAPTPNTQGAPLQLMNHTYGPEGNLHVNDPFFGFYNLIAKANITIKNVSAMDDNIFKNIKLKKRVIGEAKFLRALAYFYINTLYGGGPLRTTKNMEKTSLPRASTDSTWALIDSDLEVAANVLPLTYNADNKGRATKGAAESMLGKSYLYQKEYSKAAAEFKKVIDSHVYHLLKASDFGGNVVAAMYANFEPGGVNDNTAESVFQVQFKAGTGYNWANDGTGKAELPDRPNEYGVSGYAFFNIKPSKTLINAFNPKDPRLKAFFFGPNGDQTYGKIPYKPIYEKFGYAWKKYEADGGPQGNDVAANENVIRYAGVLLMYAEAEIKQGDIATGIKYINKIRRRADPSGKILANHPINVSQKQAFKWLRKERERELCGENIRFMDLVRWKLASKLLPTFNAPKNRLFPIPHSEIVSNTKISPSDQNTGYH
jgi:hypothetical protein